MQKRLPTWQEMNLDTPIEIEMMQIRLYQALSTPEKVKRIAALNRQVKRTAMRSLARRYPDATERELNYRYVVECYGQEIADQFLNFEEMAKL
ncbi:MAG TPA: hypothetical protein ENK06_10025 [Gammaproteobacteria bacterium]|nr:hypothetical protein [Gammaproteobacteria bacterium]